MLTETALGSQDTTVHNRSSNLTSTCSNLLYIVTTLLVAGACLREVHDAAGVWVNANRASHHLEVAFIAVARILRALSTVKTTEL